MPLPRACSFAYSKGTLSGGQVYGLSSATFGDLAKPVHSKGDPLWSPGPPFSPCSLSTAFGGRSVHSRGDGLHSPRPPCAPSSPRSPGPPSSPCSLYTTIGDRFV